MCARSLVTAGMIVARSWELNTEIKAQAVRLVLDEGRSVVASPAVDVDGGLKPAYVSAFFNTF